MITDEEWLAEKLNSVKNKNTPEYTAEMCRDLIRHTFRWPGVTSWRLLLSDVWKVAQLSQDNKNQLILMAEDIYGFAMRYHKDSRNKNGDWRSSK